MLQLASVDQALRAATDAGQVAGVVAIATTDKETIYQAAFGKRDLGKADAMTANDVFWIASMTKAITGVAAMQLVEQGKLSLDAPIGKVLPDLATVQVLDGFDAGGKAILRAVRRAITLRHLMTHTAGYGYGTWNANLARYMEQAELPAARTGQLKALSVPLTFDPGERWQYGINIDWVGLAVEAVSGKRLDAYLRDHIFTPLGMTSTGFMPTADMNARRVSMHQRQADGSLTPLPQAPAVEPEFFAGGGGLYGTAPDYIRFIRMLLNGGTLDGNRVLKAETISLMGENHIGDINVEPMRTTMPAVSSDFEPWPEQDKKWGLSFLINTKRTAEGRSPGSLTWAGLANTYFWVDPARKVGGAIFMQFLPFADRKALELFAALERGVYQALDGTRKAA